MLQLRVFVVLNVLSCFFVIPARRTNGELGEKSLDTGTSVSYKALAHAKASYSSKSEKTVLVEAGGVVLHLTRNGIDEHAFKDFQWQEPEPSDLSAVDTKYIDDYTGRFDYSRNVGVVLRGITPYTTGEDPANKFTEANDHAKLTLEVLKWTVGFGVAMNKLPDLPHARPLWRGAWETSAHVKHMETLPRDYSVPWFQPMSSDESYAPKFLGAKYQPNACRDKKGGCIGTGESFPVLYEFATSVAKDLTHWNPAESEFMFLPNTPAKITNVTKIINDKFLEMDNNALVAWLSSDDLRPIDPNDKTRLGPFPELAAAVKSKGWNGRKFIDEYEGGYLTGPKGRYDYHLKYLVHLGIDDDKYPSEKEGQLTQALKNRFKLPPLKGERYVSVVSNSVPFYYKIVGVSQ